MKMKMTAYDTKKNKTKTSQFFDFNVLQTTQAKLMTKTITTKNLRQNTRHELPIVQTKNDLQHHNEMTSRLDVLSG